jgi:hypothetical protein
LRRTVEVADSGTKRVGLYLDEGLHRRAKAKLAAEGLDFQKLLVTHLRVWTDGETVQVKAGSGDDWTAEEQAAAATLVAMMRSGDRELLPAVERILTIWRKDRGSQEAPEAKGGRDRSVSSHRGRAVG